MRTRQLGSTDLHLTEVGLGTWAMGGGGWKFAWGPQDDAESSAAVKRALDLGINWIDTAAIYGCGHSEEILGRTLKKLGVRPIIATKCGRCWGADRVPFPCLQAKSVKAEAEASLRRLQVDVIDLYQVHWPEPDEFIEEAWDTIAGLVREGKVRYAGVSNYSVAQVRRIMPIHRVASVQPPYSMLKRDAERELLPFCAQNGIGVVAYSPMQKGLLTGAWTAERVANLPEDDHRRRDPMFGPPRFEKILKLVATLGDLASRGGHTASQLAIAWVLRRPEVTAAIVGARRPSQIEETAPAAGWELALEDVAEIDRLLAQLV